MVGSQDERRVSFVVRQVEDVHGAEGYLVDSRYIALVDTHEQEEKIRHVYSYLKKMPVSSIE